MKTLGQDLRYALRGLVRTPGFTAAALATLAIGIGANAAMFSFVQAVLLRRIPVEAPDRLVRIGQTKGDLHTSVSPANLTDWRARSRTLTGVSGWQIAGVNVKARADAERVRVAFVEPSLLRLLGVQPALGRAFADAEARPGNDRVLLLTAAYWKSRLGGDLSAIGRTLQMNGAPYTIVGILPDGLEFPPLRRAEVWAPLAFDEIDLASRGSKWVSVAARLAPGASLGEARAEMADVSTDLARAYPDSNTGWSAELVLLAPDLVRGSRPMLLLLLGAAGLVLLIACANVSHLLLARANRRRREIGIRIALGASRGRVVRQLLTESLLLAVGGAGLGTLAASWVTQAVAVPVARVLPRAPRGVDPAVIGFTILVAVLASVLFGLAPAWQASRRSTERALREGGARATGSRRTTSLLVAGEVALCLILLAGAGLLLRSLARLAQVNPGFDGTDVIALNLNLPTSQYPEPASWSRFFDAARRRVAAVPGVESAAFISHRPVTQDTFGNGFTVEGRPLGRGEEYSAEMRWVSPNYFAALRIPLAAGRFLDERDHDGAPLAVVINRAFARTYFKDAEPIGRNLLIGFCRAPRQPCPPSWTIVGVVGDVHETALDLDAAPQMYVPEAQLPMSYASLLVRSKLPASAVASAVRAAVRGLDPTVAVWDVEPMEEIVDAASGGRRLLVALLTGFAVLALVLAALGVAAVMAHAVSERRREIAIRMALGARREDVVAMVLRQATRMTGAGVIVGLAGAAAASRLLRSMLFGVSATDPWVYAGAAVVLAAVGLAAAWLPARRASGVDPIVVLSNE
ncbi:MAG TPA: ABC transporter permease [Thermoanaerobaculia bacterium]|nr:ABC transporter permease [Thermoanaerobaculia bacterium]